MFGYQFVADRLIFDKKKYETLPTAMEYKINLQRDANDYVRQQCQILYNYVFTDIPLTHYNYPQEYLPNDQVNNLINSFWLFLIKDINEHYNHILTKKNVYNILNKNMTDTSTNIYQRERRISKVIDQILETMRLIRMN